MTDLGWECAKGCGYPLELHWRFCPFCGQSFGESNFGTVADSARRHDGKVRKVEKQSAPRRPGKETP